LEEVLFILLGLVSILSVFYQNLWPLVTVLLISVTKDPILVFSHGVLINFLESKQLKEVFIMPLIEMIHCLLLGFVLYFNFLEFGSTHLLLMLYPFIFRIPVAKSLKRDSGANFILIVLACVLSLLSICEEHSPTEVLLISLYLYSLILFKSLPKTVVFPLVLCVACLSVKLILHDEYFYFILTGIVFLFLWVQKEYSEKGACVKKRTAWFLHLVLSLSLLLSISGANVNIIVTVVCYAWLYFAAQKLCNLCVFALKCKDVTLIHVISLSPLIILVGLLVEGGPYLPSTVPWVLFSGLALLNLDKLSSAPMNADSLLANPCVTDFSLRKAKVS